MGQPQGSSRFFRTSRTQTRHEKGESPAKIPIFSYYSFGLGTSPDLFVLEAVFLHRAVPILSQKQPGRTGTGLWQAQTPLWPGKAAGFPHRTSTNQSGHCTSTSPQCYEDVMGRPANESGLLGLQDLLRGTWLTFGRQCVSLRDVTSGPLLNRRQSARAASTSTKTHRVLHLRP